MSTAATDLVTYHGGCHCRRVRFEVDAPSTLAVQDCNCSLCRMSGFLHLIGIDVLRVEPFDGRDWENHAASLSHLSAA